MTRTTVTRLTAPGTAALATLAIDGPRAWELARELFRPAKGNLPETPTVGRFWFGRFGDSGTEDEIILCSRSGSRVELHTHGGPRVVEWLTRLLVSRDCEPGQTETGWHDRFPIKRSSHLLTSISKRIRDDAANALLHARTARLASIVLDQLHGAFEGELEAALDDPTRLASLARFANVGRHLIDPWRVVIAGPPNVGKSSLLNAIQGYQRAIVSETPGTTRDTVSSALAIDGWPVELTDTAGLRTTEELLEGEGIERSRSAIARADLCVWVIDASAAEPELPPDSVLAADPIIVRNKIDLVSVLPTTASHNVSARTGAGVPELIRAIGRRLVPAMPAPGDAVPPGRDWSDRVERAARLENLEQIRECLLADA